MLSNLFRNLQPVTKNLLIINVIMYIALMTNPWIQENFALYNIGSEKFQPYQLITHMFMHDSSSFAHIFMNMFALVMFGSVVERQLGAKKFLVLYFVSALGALALQMGLNYYNYMSLLSNYTAEEIIQIKEIASSSMYNPATQTYLLDGVNIELGNKIPMVGASGAIMGVLVAFGYYNPNTELMLIFLPIPIKAKYFIPFYMLIELFLGVGNFQWDNIAHWAHLGGAIAGFILVFLWKRDRTNFY